MAGNRKVLNLLELSQHRSRHDCWLLIDGKVYDVTDFLKDHPGGDDVILFATGKDATHEFEEVGHSTSAKAMLSEFYVGDIDSTKANDVAITTATPTQTEQNQDNKNSELLIKRFQFLAPLLILGLALGVLFYQD
ncbi:PREDICTED: cytochrome b5-like [Camelina sativa]|uniref:Cytochrome b5-like n=1 Tax=Camelina sativa TaxID=90675 RepID=A0ABM0W1B0_CAMSA|nr:PREDICTED: cytochrome b5-like [Camelina sativa]